MMIISAHGVVEGFLFLFEKEDLLRGNIGRPDYGSIGSVNSIMLGRNPPSPIYITVYICWGIIQ